MSTLATLNVVLNGDIGGFIKSMKQAEDQSSSSSNIIQNALGGIGTVAKFAAGAAVAGVAAIGTAAFASAMEFDDAFDIIAIGTGATGEALEGLKHDFENIYTSFPTDTMNAANVVAELNTRLGLTGKNMENLAGPILEVSRLLGGDAKENAQLFSRVIGDWGLPLEDASVYLDQLFVVSQKTGVPLEKLQQQIVQFGSPLRLMGFGFEESAALFGKWEKEGVNAELVMGSLRIAAGKFAKDQVPLREGLMKTIDQIQNMKDSSAALSLGMKIFGARAGPDMVAAIREGRFAIGDLVEAMDSADGAILKTAKDTEDFPEKFTRIKNQVGAALAPLGSLIMDALGKVFDVLGPIIADAAPKITAGLQAAFGWIQTNVGPILEGLIAGLQVVIGWVQENWPAIQSTIVTTWNNIRALVEPAINAIWSFIQSVFGTIATFLQTHGDDIKKFVGDTWNTIRSIVEPVITWFYETVTKIFGGLATWINDNQAEIQRIIQGVWDGIKMFVGTVLEVIRGIVSAVLSLLKGDVSGALDAIKKMFTNIWDGIKDYVGKAVETMRMILLIVWAKIKEGVENAWNGIRTWIETAWENIMNFFRTLPDKLYALGKQIIEGLWNGIKSMFADIGKGISDFFQNTIDDIRKKLGIQSPSKIFAGIGMNMMAGLAQGIRQGADLPQLALDRVNLSAIGDAGLSGSAAGAASVNNVANTTYNITTDRTGIEVMLDRQRRANLEMFERRM